MLSFFRKLSIGGKIRDGLLPDNDKSVMSSSSTVESAVKDIMQQRDDLAAKDETELKESVYGEFFIIII